MTELSSVLADPNAREARRKLAELREAIVPVETLDLLYGLVRVAKPTLVLQTHVGSGFEAAAIACALEANGRGGLWTLVKDPERAVGAQQLWATLGVGVWIQALPETVADFVHRYHGPFFELVLLNSPDAEAELALLSARKLVEGTAVITRGKRPSERDGARLGLAFGCGLRLVPVSRRATP